MRCGNCYHAQLDHAPGRCVNRTGRLHRATGVSVVTVCGCKHYEDEVKATARKAAPPERVEEAGDEPAEPETESESPPTRSRRRSERELTNG